MPDKAISELVAASQVKPADLFVLEQDGAAKKLTGQTLENWLLTLADGHGGIQSITKTGTSGLKDTYRITLADETYQDIQVTNGRGITGFAKTGTSGLVDTWRVSYNDGTHTDISVTNGRGITKNELVSTSGLVKTYRITYNDGTTQTYTVTDGAKGDKGDNTYTHIKYASQEPTAASHSMGDVPDAWMGIYTGALATAPTDWTLYKWNKVKGEQGDTGNPATLVSNSVTYLVSDRGDIVPSGSWSTTIPTVGQGKYLWTRVITTFNSGSPVTSYSVARMGIDGTGSVSSVNSQNPDSTGNVKLTAADIAGSDGQSIEAALAGKQAKITSVGLLKGTGSGVVTDAVAGTDYQTPLEAGTDYQTPLAAGVDYQTPLEAGTDYQAPISAGAGIKIVENKVSAAAAPWNLLDNSNFLAPVNQRGKTSITENGMFIDRWRVFSDNVSIRTASITSNGIQCGGTKVVRQIVPKEKLFGLSKSNFTCAVGKKDGTVVIITDGWTDSSGNFIFPLPAGTWAWAAMYVGTYTAQTLPQYQSKGYTAEELECKRYFLRLGSSLKFGYKPVGLCVGRETGRAETVIMFPTQMRAAPSIAHSGTFMLVPNFYNVKNLSIDTVNPDAAAVNVYADEVSTGAAFILSSDNDKNAFIDFIADL